MPEPRVASTDVLVIGAGPVGLATAIALATRGATVRVLDRRLAPIDKPCGEGIMPHGVEALERLGVDPVRAGGRPFRGIRYIDGSHRVEGYFPGTSGVAVRRTVLQAELLRRARRAGAEVELGRVVRDLVAEGGEWRGVVTDDGERRARWIVGADGLRSRLRQLSGLDRGARGGRFGIRRHYAVEPWTDLVEVYWSDGCEAYVTPVTRREIGVAMLWEGGKGGFDEHLERFPALRDRLVGAERTSRDLGAGPLERRVRAVADGRLALVGDASGYIDAITGEGLSVGFLQAEALAAALAAGEMRDYARAHRRIGRWPGLLTRGLLAVKRRPALRRRLIAAFAAEPALFGRLLEIHARGRRPGSIEPGALLRMGRLLAAD